MAENVEQIEARLCEYIDGAMDAAERAQIERHLAANPAHMQLVHELISHRQQLQQLPRDKAPADLMEPLQSQFEREALLGSDPAMESQMVLQPSRWPQLLSAAAVLFLAAGLGTIVYFVLPPKHPAVGLVPQPAHSDSAIPDNLATEVLAPEGAAGALAAQPAAPPLTFAAGTESRDMVDKLKDSPAGDRAAAGAVAMREPNPVEAGKSLPDNALGAPMALHGAAFFADAHENQMLLITVKAADVKLANEEVVHYLKTNHLAWSPASGKLEEVAAPPAPAIAAAPASENLAAAPAALSPATPALPALMGGFGGGGAAPAAPPAATAAPVVARADDAQPRRDEMLRASAARGLLALTATAKENVIGPAILVRDMNGRQVTELAASLSQPERQQWAQVQREVALKLSSARRSAAPSRALALADRADAGPTARPDGNAPATRPAQGLLVTARSSLDSESSAASVSSAPLEATTQPAATAAAFGLAAAPESSDRVLTAGRASADAYNCVIVFEDSDLFAATRPAAEGPATQPESDASAKPIPAPATRPTD